MSGQIYFNREQHHLEFMQLLDLLPEHSRMIFLLHYGEGFGTKEVAELLGINENTVKTRLRRGRMPGKTLIDEENSTDTCVYLYDVIPITSPQKLEQVTWSLHMEQYEKTVARAAWNMKSREKFSSFIPRCPLLLYLPMAW